MLGQGTGETLYMVGSATLFSYLFGLPLGVVSVVTETNGILPNSKLHSCLDKVINIGRSIPFIILLIAMIPLTRLIVGTSIGSTASVVPLVIAAVPFVARMVETALKEIDQGMIEAAQSMGASPWQIIKKVMIPETMPSLILGASITTITLIGYSAMAGVVGGGGLGDLAIRYGYYRYQKDIMFLTIVLLVVFVQVVQSLGNYLSRKMDKKNK
ncbi:methionine ABC transporter permease [Candidatus Formimonas warabiya]|uniref:Methionine ABC transporter permease n=2 Tax=Formimonas warabiya TaxID=1761012 RepID=A0A3G1L2F1_FORW1|nr:methionine ABC transporter permease [Candidatus Formimonas warabiya]